MTRNFFDKLNIQYKEDISLRNYNTYRINTICKFLVFPKNIEELIEIMDNSIRAEFDNENYDIKQCKLKAGVAFDVEVDIYIWIIQKFSKIEFK